MDPHRSRILDQFTRQAAPFSSAPAIRDQAALDWLVALAKTGAKDAVLDVGCGPGLLVCAFAKVARHVTGMDLTPAMLDQGRQLQEQQELNNVSWVLGDIQDLPYADASFSVVASRFVFHHLERPLLVLKEMRRVCRSGGRVLVADMSPQPAKAAALDQVEKLRDPSHVHALPEPEFRDLFAQAGLMPRVEHYRLEGELEGLLSRSFPPEGNADLVRRAFEGSLENDALDLATRKEDGKIFYSFPVAVLVATKE